MLASLLCIFSACGEKAENSTKLFVVCTTFPQYDFAKNIAGDKAEIMLLDSTTDIHSFEPTASDIITISNANLFIFNGGVSDAWVEKALESAGNEKLAVLSLMGTVKAFDEEAVEGMETDEEEAEPDEHIWLSLKNAKVMTEAICNCLCALDPSGADVFKKNTADYVRRLDELDKKYAEAVSSAKRKTVLFADRFPFRYLVEDYGIEYYAAFSGCSSETAASFETVAFLIEKTKELALPVILITESSDGSIAETVCSQAGSKYLVLDSCQSVHMEQIENGADYIGIMAKNLEVLKTALN